MRLRKNVIYCVRLPAIDLTPCGQGELVRVTAKTEATHCGVQISILS